MKIEDLKPDPGNPRCIDPDALGALGYSLTEFGDLSGITWSSRRGVLVAGHQRMAALREKHGDALRMDGNDVVTPDGERFRVRVVDWPKAKEMAAAIAANSQYLAGSWTEGLLPILDEIKQELPDLSDVLRLEDLRNLLPKIEDAPIPEDADDVGAPPKKAFSKLGDLWLLGDHRLLAGDSTRAEDVARVMNGEKAALAAFDPPYLVDYTGERPDHDGGNSGGKDWTDVYHEVDIQDAGKFFRDIFTRVLEVLAPNAAIYCWHAHKRQAEIATIWKELGILDHQQIIFFKPTPVFGRVFWPFQHEVCVMGWRQGSMPSHDGDLSFSSVWEVDWEGKKRIVGNEHPTQKPVELFARPMRKHTKPGDICFEPFSGSASQIVAGEILKRKVYALEIEPVFVDLGVSRWMAMSGGKTPRLERDGRMWEWPEIQAAGFGGSDIAPSAGGPLSRSPVQEIPSACADPVDV